MPNLKEISIDDLGLNPATTYALKQLKVRNLEELIDKAQTTELYNQLPTLPKEAFNTIDSILYRKYNLSLPNIDYLKQRCETITDIIFDRRILTRLLNYGIVYINELKSLTQEELHGLPEINNEPLTENICKYIINTMHNEGLKFADETEQSIGIEQKPVIILKLSIQAFNVLKNGNIRLVSDLIDKTEDELKKLNGMNDDILREIKTKLESNAVIDSRIATIDERIQALEAEKQALIRRKCEATNGNAK